MDQAGALQSWVDEAVAVAMKSPCQSKRGVIIANSETGQLISSGYNDQPKPFLCNGSDECKGECRRTAIHAEQAALMAARGSVLGATLLHVKAKDNRPCASGEPSCLQCSKLILHAGIDWVLLLHEENWPHDGEVDGQVDGVRLDWSIGKLNVVRYSAVMFHWLSARWNSVDLDVGGQCAV